MAEGVGFEPTETHKTSTVFETVPFVHSGILPGGRLAAATGLAIRQCFLKTPAQGADGTFVADTNLFPDEAGFTPRPAWQVIEAARRQYLTGELTLPTNPATRIFLRDGLVYFAERSSDGTLPVRLMMEGVITRAQMQRATVIVNGVEHVGRMFDSDPSIDRASVELCAELFTDDVMVSVANTVVSSYEMNLYRRHSSGIDRWYPHSVPVPTQIERAAAGGAAAGSRTQGPCRRAHSRRRRRRETQAPAGNPHGDPTRASLRVAARAPGAAAEQPHRPADHPGRAGDQAGATTTPPPPPITQAVPVTSARSTTQVPVTMPAPTTQIPVTQPATASDEVDHTAIADEVAEAIKRAFAGMGAGL